MISAAPGPTPLTTLLPYLMGVRVSREGRMMVTVVSVSRVWSISGRRMVMDGEVLAEMRWRRPPMLPSGAVILKS